MHGYNHEKTVENAEKSQHQLRAQAPEAKQDDESENQIRHTDSENQGAQEVADRRFTAPVPITSGGEN